MTIEMLKKQSGVLINGSEIGFPYFKIIEVIMAYKNEGVKILGGDIYIKKNEKFIPSYDSWCYEGSDCDESIARSLEYINAYPFKGDMYVVVVPN